MNMLCDLHRHFSGAISCETVSNILDVDIEIVKKRMTYSSHENVTYDSFFEKFNIFNEITWTKELIAYTIQDCIWGIKKEGIDYAEIKFTIDKYKNNILTNDKEIISWIAHNFEEFSSKYGINVDLILCLKHDLDKSRQLEIANLIKDDIIAECICGIDVVGNEKYFEVEFYKPIFEMWNNAKKACMIHVGEIYNPKNVYDAINNLKIDRICHGIAVCDDKELAKKTSDKLISFDICPTSNLFTGVAKIKDHPVSKMLNNGFLITIGTDDPVIFNTTIQKEYNLIKQICKLSDEDINLLKEIVFSFSADSIIRRKSQ